MYGGNLLQLPHGERSLVFTRLFWISIMIKVIPHNIQIPSTKCILQRCITYRNQQKKKLDKSYVLSSDQKKKIHIKIICIYYETSEGST